MNNPPAFPVAWDFGNEAGINDGMTLRDYFAAKAMHSLLASGIVNRKAVSQAAYLVADAMLKARAE